MPHITLKGGPLNGQRHEHNPADGPFVSGAHYYRPTDTPGVYAYDRRTRQRTLVPISQDPAMIERAAAIYKAAGLTGLPPGKAVAGALGVGMATGGRLIRAARDAGLLPAATRGKATFTASEHTPRRVRWSDGSQSWNACASCRQPWPCEDAIADNAEGLQ